MMAQEQRRAALERVVASLAHGLAGPLNVMAGRATLLAMQATDEKSRANAESIQAQVKELAAILARVRDFADAQLPASESVDLAALSASVFEEVSPLAESRSVRVTHQPASGTCRVPRVGLTLALQNLATYAVRAAEPETEVRLKLEQRDAAPSSSLPTRPCIYFEVDFTPAPGTPKTDSKRSRCEPWLLEPPAAAPELGLLLATSCGAAHDRGGWSESQLDESRKQLAFFWPIGA